MLFRQLWARGPFKRLGAFPARQLEFFLVSNGK
jgi:hypothetical protein